MQSVHYQRVKLSVRKHGTLTKREIIKHLMESVQLLREASGFRQDLTVAFSVARKDDVSQYAARVRYWTTRLLILDDIDDVDAQALVDSTYREILPG